MGVVGRHQHVPIIRDDSDDGELERQEVAREENQTRIVLDVARHALKEVGLEQDASQNLAQ